MRSEACHRLLRHRRRLDVDSWVMLDEVTFSGKPLLHVSYGKWEYHAFWRMLPKALGRRCVGPCCCWAAGDPSSLHSYFRVLMT